MIKGINMGSDKQSRSQPACSLRKLFDFFWYPSYSPPISAEAQRSLRTLYWMGGFSGLLGIILLVFAIPGLKSSGDKLIGISIVLANFMFYVAMAVIIIKQFKAISVLRTMGYLRCPQCKYNLEGLPGEGACPECKCVYKTQVLKEHWEKRYQGKIDY